MNTISVDKELLRLDLERISVDWFVILERNYFLCKELNSVRNRYAQILKKNFSWNFCFLFLNRFISVQLERFSYSSQKCDKNTWFSSNISVQFLNISSSGATALQDKIPPRFQICFKEISIVFQGSFKGVSRKFQGCF